MENDNDIVLYLIELKRKYKNKFYILLKALVIFASTYTVSTLFDLEVDEVIKVYLMLQCLNEIERQNILSKIDDELCLYDDCKKLVKTN